MPYAIRPLHQRFGAEIVGADLSSPLTDAQFAEIRDAFDTHSLLLFRGPVIDDDQQLAFSRRFGTVAVSYGANQTGGTYFSRQSNIDVKTGELLPPDHDRMHYQKGNRLWHSDRSYRDTASLCSILSAREVPPEGGNTEFVSLRAAWDDLPDELKRKAEGLFTIHSIVYSRGLIDPDILTQEQKDDAPPAHHPLVQTNPANGRKALFIGAHASHIDGWPVEEGRAFLADLLARATTGENIYSHAWRQGDVLVWDNRCLMHRATPFDANRYRRLMQRTTVIAEAATSA